MSRPVPDSAFHLGPPLLITSSSRAPCIAASLRSKCERHRFYVPSKPFVVDGDSRAVSSATRARM